MTEPPRRRGRPPGAKNRAKGPSVDLTGEVVASAAAPSPDPLPPAGTSRASLEADRDRLLEGIAACRGDAPCPACGQGVTDWKTIAALQSQLNGVNRMLLRITGETAPTDANLIRSPQWLRIRSGLVEILKKHPAALAEVSAYFDTAEN